MRSRRATGRQPSCCAVLALRLVACLLIALPGVRPAEAQAPTGIQRVAWMTGCWRLTAGDRVVDEQWMAPAGGTMLGISRTVRNGALREYEFVVLRERGDTLVFLAHPSGQAAGEFTLKSAEASTAIFENLAHDFPQRVGYRLRDGRLDAWIEGTAGGAARRIDFPYQRVACE